MSLLHRGDSFARPRTSTTSLSTRTEGKRSCEPASHGHGDGGQAARRPPELEREPPPAPCRAFKEKHGLVRRQTDPAGQAKLLKETQAARAGGGSRTPRALKAEKLAGLPNTRCVTDEGACSNRRG